jgi:hypothetical protein
MAYRYPSIASQGDCGGCSSSSRPCTPVKKIVKTVTLDFSSNDALSYTGSSGAPFFFRSLQPTADSGFTSKTTVPVGANLLSAQYTDSRTPKTTEGALFSAAVATGTATTPSGYLPLQILIPTGPFATAQAVPTGVFTVYYI